MDTHTIEQLIVAGLAECDVQVSGDDGVHFQARVISPAFAGKSRLQRHRMVYQTLGELMGNEIHALTLTTETPEEAG